MADRTPPPRRRGQSDVTVVDLPDRPGLTVAGEAIGGVERAPPGGDRRRRPEAGPLPGKLRPALAVSRRLSASLRGLLAPRPGSLVLVHAAAGYGKTTA